MIYKRYYSIILLAALLIFCGLETDSSCKNEPVKKQTVYVAVYSSIFHGDREHEFNLAVTVSVRNTDMQNSITLEKVDYYGTSGKFIKHYLKAPLTLRPLESTHFVVKESDVEGGPGANCIITWHTNKSVSMPLIESIMIGTRGQQGISFTSRGVVID